jgi:hypothetical protein
MLTEGPLGRCSCLFSEGLPLQVLAHEVLLNRLGDVRVGLGTDWGVETATHSASIAQKLSLRKGCAQALDLLYWESRPRCWVGEEDLGAQHWGLVIERM